MAKVSSIISYEGSHLSTRYDFIGKIGEGSFRCVFKAIIKYSGEVIAIKVLKDRNASGKSIHECLNLREVKALFRLRHPNIIKLKELVREDDYLCMVFEYMDHSLEHVITRRKEAGMFYFSDTEIRNHCFQIVKGLHHMHSRGYFHRDLKPDNLLLKDEQLKIADLGSAREISGDAPYTEYVTTRWYRAPEVLLMGGHYGSAVDMWALGAILAEMYLLRPIFPGKHAADQIYRICSIMGTPGENSSPFVHQLAKAAGYQFPDFFRVPLSALISWASEDAIDLMESLLSWDPDKRPTAMEALQHAFFKPCHEASAPCFPKFTMNQHCSKAPAKFFGPAPLVIID